MSVPHQKVLILGDSYAAKGKNIGSTSDLSWSELLEKDNRYQVTNLAEGGSSLWFSFKNFLKHQENYDKIVFIVTEPNRLYFPIKESNPKIIHHNVGSVRDLNRNIGPIRDLEKDEINFEKIKTIKLYFKYILDTNEKELHQKLMIKEIRETRPDTILIPAFSDSIFDHQGDCLIDITDRETTSMKLKMHDIFIKYHELRACHMIDENNQILYEHVLRWLDGEPVVINKNDFKKMAKKDFEKYLPLRKDINNPFLERS